RRGGRFFRRGGLGRGGGLRCSSRGRGVPVRPAAGGQRTGQRQSQHHTVRAFHSVSPLVVGKVLPGCFRSRHRRHRRVVGADLQKGVRVDEGVIIDVGVRFAFPNGDQEPAIVGHGGGRHPLIHRRSLFHLLCDLILFPCLPVQHPHL